MDRVILQFQGERTMTLDVESAEKMRRSFRSARVRKDVIKVEAKDGRTLVIVPDKVLFWTVEP